MPDTIQNSDQKTTPPRPNGQARPNGRQSPNGPARPNGQTNPSGLPRPGVHARTPYRAKASVAQYRIDLLPPYVREWMLGRTLTIAFTLIFIVSVVFCLITFVTLSSQAAAAEQRAQTMEAAKRRVTAVQDEAKATLAQVQPIQDKLDFVQKVDDYRDQWIKLYVTLGDRTARSGFIYTDASVKGTAMTIKAYSPTVQDVTVYLQAMYQEPDFASATVDKVVGFPDDSRHLYYLDGHLVFADGAVPPVVSASPGVGPTDFNPDQVGPNGANNIPPGVGPPPPEIAVKYLGGFSGAAAPAAGGTMGASGYSPAFLKVATVRIGPFAPPQIRDALLKQALRRVVVKTVAKGFDITVTATLKKPMTPPLPPGTQPAASATATVTAPNTQDNGP